MKTTIHWIVVAASSMAFVWGCGELDEPSLGELEDGQSDGKLDGLEEEEEDGSETFPMDEFFARFSDAVLPGCGTFELCWYDVTINECTQTRPAEGVRETIDFRIRSEDPMKRAYFAINLPENLLRTTGADGADIITYQETYPKSMPPGPAREVGFLSRYTLTIEATGSEIHRLRIYQEDYDPRDGVWSLWFDIRYDLENPLICE